LKQAVPLTNSSFYTKPIVNTNSIKYGAESKTTILLNQQSHHQLPESGAAIISTSSAASSPFLRASLHDVISQTESPLDSPRMPAFAPINIYTPRNPVAQQCAQVQTEAPPAHLEGEYITQSSVLTHSDSYVNVLSAAQIKEFIDAFRAKTRSSL